MIEPKNKKLTKKIFDKLVIKDIIYAECDDLAHRGVQWAIIYTIIDDNFICYETEDVKLYNIIVDVMIENTYENIHEDYYDYEGEIFILAFSSVFLNKKASFKIGKDHFLYTKNKIEYKIYPYAIHFHESFSIVSAADIAACFSECGIFGGFLHFEMKRLPSEKRISQKRFKEWLLKKGLKKWLIEGYLEYDETSGNWDLVKYLSDCLEEEGLLSILYSWLEKNKSEVKELYKKLRKKDVIK